MYEIIGKEAPSSGYINKHILNTKNSIKRIDGEYDLELSLDINKEAKEIISRAIENFKSIPSLQISEELLAYYQYEKITNEST